MNIHILEESRGRLWCGARKIGKEDLIVTTKRYDRFGEQTASGELILDAQDAMAADAPTPSGPSIESYLGWGNTCFKCSQARARAD